MIHVRIPYRQDKNLGKAYNDEFDLCPEEDWLCFIDHDVLFLTPDAINIMEEYVKLYPDTGLFCCRTNRIHPLAQYQLVDPSPSLNTNVEHWMERAYNQKRLIPKFTEVQHEVSGFLMLISKKTWRDIKFIESGRALGVDNDYCWRLLDAGKSIRCMEGLLVWHTYRLKDIKDKTHLH